MSTGLRKPKLKGTRSANEFTSLPPLPAIDPALLADIYCMAVHGSCLEPTIPDGAVLLVDKRQRPAPGDIVVVYPTPEARQRMGDDDAYVKQLIIAPPAFVEMLPFETPPGGDLMAVFGLRMFNPPRELFPKCRDVLAMHKVVGMRAEMRKPMTSQNFHDAESLLRAASALPRRGRVA